MVERRGEKIGRYRIIAPIGSGGFATVYRAVDERLGSEVAIKVLAENHSLIPDHRERFISEAQHLRRVDSYWVASIYDLSETDSGQPYMVLELADRGDLETRVNDLWDKRRGLERTDLLILAETLAHSLQAIHSADLVHRDVTPGNLLVRNNGLRPAAWSGRTLLDRGERLILSDLGYAKDLRAASGITSGGGTAGFAAPEQHGEMTQVDTRADIYGASAVLQWAATGSRHVDALAPVCAIGMSEDPGDRYNDMTSWNAAVRTALQSPYAAMGSTAALDDVEPRWARPWLAAVAGLSIGFILAAMMWFDGSDTDTSGRAVRLIISSVNVEATASTGDTTGSGLSVPTTGAGAPVTTTPSSSPPLSGDGVGTDVSLLPADTRPRPETPAAANSQISVMFDSVTRPAGDGTIAEVSGTATAVEGLVAVQLAVIGPDGQFYDPRTAAPVAAETAVQIPVIGGEGQTVTWSYQIATTGLPAGEYDVAAMGLDRLGRHSSAVSTGLTIGT
ncbi:MAG: serine/threonine-protein kinase [Acidimicrobiales bacterium]